MTRAGARGGLGGNDPLAGRARRVPSVIPSAGNDVGDDGDDLDQAQPAAAKTTTKKATQRATQKAAQARTVTKSSAKSTKAVPDSKRQVTVYIDSGIDNAARNAILALMSNPAGPRNLSSLIETAIANEIQRLQTSLHDGKPFPQRQVELQPGRPVGN